MAGQIDRDKVRSALRNLGNENIFYLLYDAVELMPLAKLEELVSPYLDLKTLRPDSGPPGSLLANVESFARASRAGDYYEEFRVDSRNSTQKSTGTVAWIAECNRLLARCVAKADSGDASELRQCFDIIFGLLDEIDADLRDIIFFADEAGSWQVGVDWSAVLPSWFKVLSATSTPEDYASRVVHVVSHHCGHEGPTLLAVGRKLATPEQQRALAAA